MKAIIRAAIRPFRLGVLLALTAAFLPSCVLAQSTGISKAPAVHPPQEPADLAALDKLFADGLFDPKDYEFVQFDLADRTGWADADKLTVTGWLVKSQDKKATPWAMLISGEAVPVTGPTTPDDFAERCKTIMDKAEERARHAPASQPAGNGRSVSPRIREGPSQEVPLPCTYMAAWLKRVGQDALALRMAKLSDASLPEHGIDPEDTTLPRRESASYWYECGQNAYVARADGECRFYLRHLQEYFPKAMIKPADGVTRQHYYEAIQILAELERRENEPVTPDELPADFRDWRLDRRVAYLIHGLQDVEDHSDHFLGPMDYHTSEKLVVALIEIGEPAVPALIDCVEKDTRLTRALDPWSMSLGELRTVETVRELAYMAASAILHMNHLYPPSAGDVTAAGMEQTRATVAALRSYWKTYGLIPFDQRMMTILADRRATSDAWREAADNLAHPNPTGSGETPTTGRSNRANPVVGKFKDPIAAEAIIAAMDRDLARSDRGEDNQAFPACRQEIEHQYFRDLGDLQDPSIIPALLKRLDGAPNIDMRRQLSAVCFALGDERPLTKFAEDFAAGRVQVAAGDVEELGQIVAVLSSAAPRLPVADSALYALASPAHKQHALCAMGIRGAMGLSRQGIELSHPFVLYFLRRELDEVRPSVKTCSIIHDNGNDYLEEASLNGTETGPVPEPLCDPAARMDRVDARVCDVAAATISELVLGVSYCHPLLKDEDRRVQQLKTFLDRSLPHFRLATSAETSALGLWGRNGRFRLDVRRSNRGATPAETATGQALFDFDGKGTPLDIKLPAVATLRKDAPPAGKQPTTQDFDAGRASPVYPPSARPGDKPLLEWVVPTWLVVQAERGPDGKIYYGLISRYEMRRICEDEVAEVKPLGDH